MTQPEIKLQEELEKGQKLMELIIKETEEIRQELELVTNHLRQLKNEQRK